MSLNADAFDLHEEPQISIRNKYLVTSAVVIFCNNQNTAKPESNRKKIHMGITKSD